MLRFMGSQRVGHDLADDLILSDLQPGLPSPVAIPEGRNIIVIDLQDYFFTIPFNAEKKK